MNKDERITYTEMALRYEWQKIGELLFIEEPDWEAEWLANDEVDPLGLHKPFGLAAPQYIRDKWYLCVCLPAFLRPVEECDDDTLSLWIRYWLEHEFLHIVVSSWQIQLDEQWTLLEIEQRVVEEMRELDPEIEEAGERLIARGS